MTVGFFLLKFPVASETFVLNQIVAFIEMGFDVEIVAMHRGDLAQTHAAWQQYRLAEKTTWLLEEPENRLGKLKFRAARTLKGAGKLRTWRALNGLRYGAEARNLILSAICASVAGQIAADVFIAHFGPAGVTAVKLRELGVLRGKVATVFHGVDVSHRTVLAHYLPEYRRLFARGDIMLQISDLWAARLREMAARRKKLPCRAWASTWRRLPAGRQNCRADRWK